MQDGIIHHHETDATARDVENVLLVAIIANGAITWLVRFFAWCLFVAATVNLGGMAITQGMPLLSKAFQSPEWSVSSFLTLTMALAAALMVWYQLKDYRRGG